MEIQPTRKASQGPEWIVIYVTHNLQEAHIMAGKLGANDVPSMIHQEAGATALGITLGHLGEIKVLVSPADYERAVAILFPAADVQLEANTDKLRLIWRDDKDDAEYDVEDEDDE